MAGPSLPTIPRNVDPKVRQAFDSIKAYFKTVEASGGLITKSQISSGSISIPQKAIIDDGSVAVLGGALPAPENLQAFSGVGTVRLTWDWYYGSGIAYTEIYRSDVNDLSLAVMVAQVEGVGYTDNPSTNPFGKSFYYWIRYAGTDETTKSPYNAVNGTLGQTVDDPGYALALIEGLVTESHLSQTLNSRINLIDTEFIFDEGGFDEEIFSGLVDTYQSLFQNTSNLTDITNQTLSKLATLESEVSSLITTEWSEGARWEEGQYVIYNGTVYVCLQTHSAPSPNPAASPTYWDQTDGIVTLIADIDYRVDELEHEISTKVSQADFNVLSGRVTDSETAITQNSNDILLRASKVDIENIVGFWPDEFDPNTPYSTADYCLYGDALYQCTDDVSDLPSQAPNIAIAFWEPVDSVATVANTALSEVRVAADNIELVSQTITGPIAVEDDLDDGVFVKDSDDVEDLDIRLTTARINIDSANKRIDIALSDINTALNQIATANQTLEVLTGDLEAEARARTEVAAQAEKNKSAIESEVKARADAISAEAQSRELLAASIGDDIVAIEESMSVAVNNIGDLQAQYTVKIDNNGYVTGFGLASEVVDGVPFSEFMVNANRFAIIDPNGIVVTISSLTQSSGLATAVTSAAHGFSSDDTVAIAGATLGQYNGQKTITVVDTTTFTFPISNDPPSPAVAMDGMTLKVMKTIVPFVVQGGVTYINSAIMGNAVIGSAQLKEAIINSSHIDTLDASKITTGTLEGVSVKTVDQATGNYSILTGGDLVFYRGGSAYKYLKEIQNGSGLSGSEVTIISSRAPKVLVSIRDLRAYDINYADQSQRWTAKLSDDGVTDNGDGTYSFTPICQLTLDSGSSTEDLSYNYSGASTFTSGTKTTPANTTSITVSGTLNSSRGTGTSSNYYYRQATVRLYYRISGGSWAYTTKTIAHGGDLTTDDFTITKSSLTSGTYEYYIYISWADAGGTFTSGSVQYEYDEDKVENTDTGALSYSQRSYDGSVSDTQTFDLPSYSAPSGWEIYNVSYSIEYAYELYAYRSSITVSSRAGRGYSFSTGSYIYGDSPAKTSGDISSFITKTWESSSFEESISYSTNVTIVDNSSLSNASAWSKNIVRNFSATIKIRKEVANSTTASNSAIINDASFELSSATVIDNGGVVNWIAIA